MKVSLPLRTKNPAGTIQNNVKANSKLMKYFNYPYIAILALFWHPDLLIMLKGRFQKGALTRDYLFKVRKVCGGMRGGALIRLDMSLNKTGCIRLNNG